MTFKEFSMASLGFLMWRRCGLLLNTANPLDHVKPTVQHKVIYPVSTTWQPPTKELVGPQSQTLNKQGGCSNNKTSKNGGHCNIYPWLLEKICRDTQAIRGTIKRQTETLPTGWWTLVALQRTSFCNLHGRRNTRSESHLQAQRRYCNCCC